MSLIMRERRGGREVRERGNRREGVVRKLNERERLTRGNNKRGRGRKLNERERWTRG